MGLTSTKERLGKAALAKSNAVSFTIEGVYEDDRQKFGAMVQDLGITFDSNNNVLNNTIKIDTTSNTAHKNMTGNPHGTTLSDIATLDGVPTGGSTNPVESDGIFDALASKQDTLTIDNTPTDGSTNLVKSNGIFDALASKQDTITGYNGNITVVTAVDFTGETTTTQTITITNGIVTNVV